MNFDDRQNGPRTRGMDIPPIPADAPSDAAEAKAVSLWKLLMEGTLRGHKLRVGNTLRRGGQRGAAGQDAEFEFIEGQAPVTSGTGRRRTGFDPRRYNLKIVADAMRGGKARAINMDTPRFVYDETTGKLYLPWASAEGVVRSHNTIPRDERAYAKDALVEYPNSTGQNPNLHYPPGYGPLDDETASEARQPKEPVSELRGEAGRKRYVSWLNAGGGAPGVTARLRDFAEDGVPVHFRFSRGQQFDRENPAHPLVQQAIDRSVMRPRRGMPPPIGHPRSPLELLPPREHGEFPQVNIRSAPQQVDDLMFEPGSGVWSGDMPLPKRHPSFIPRREPRFNPNAAHDDVIRTITGRLPRRRYQGDPNEPLVVRANDEWHSDPTTFSRYRQQEFAGSQRDPSDMRRFHTTPKPPAVPQPPTAQPAPSSTPTPPAQPAMPKPPSGPMRPSGVQSAQPGIDPRSALDIGTIQEHYNLKQNPEDPWQRAESKVRAKSADEWLSGAKVNPRSGEGLTESAIRSHQSGVRPGWQLAPRMVEAKPYQGDKPWVGGWRGALRGGLGVAGRGIGRGLGRVGLGLAGTMLGLGTQNLGTIGHGLWGIGTGGLSIAGSPLAALGGAGIGAAGYDPSSAATQKDWWTQKGTTSDDTWMDRHYRKWDQPERTEKNSGVVGAGFSRFARQPAPQASSDPILDLLERLRGTGQPRPQTQQQPQQRPPIRRPVYNPEQTWPRVMPFQRQHEFAAPGGAPSRVMFPSDDGRARPGQYANAGLQTQQMRSVFGPQSRLQTTHPPFTQLAQQGRTVLVGPNGETIGALTPANQVPVQPTRLQPIRPQPSTGWEQPRRFTRQEFSRGENYGRQKNRGAEGFGSAATNVQNRPEYWKDSLGNMGFRTGLYASAESSAVDLRDAKHQSPPQAVNGQQEFSILRPDETGAGRGLGSQYPRIVPRKPYESGVSVEYDPKNVAWYGRTIPEDWDARMEETGRRMAALNMLQDWEGWGKAFANHLNVEPDDALDNSFGKASDERRFNVLMNPKHEDVHGSVRGIPLEKAGIRRPGRGPGRGGGPVTGRHPDFSRPQQPFASGVADRYSSCVPPMPTMRTPAAQRFPFMRGQGFGRSEPSQDELLNFKRLNRRWIRMKGGGLVRIDASPERGEVGERSRTLYATSPEDGVIGRGWLDIDANSEPHNIAKNPAYFHPTVKSKFRGRGLGYALYNRAAELARGRTLEPTEQASDDANRLWEKMNWRIEPKKGPQFACPPQQGFSIGAAESSATTLNHFYPAFRRSSKRRTWNVA